MYLPRILLDINFNDTLKLSMKKSSLFTEGNNDKDRFTYTCRVNREYKKFKLNKLKPYMFKCPIFIWGLTVEKDTVVRTKILAKLVQN